MIRTFHPDKYNGNRNIIIYGAGVYGELCLRGLEACGVTPYAFADRRTDIDDYLGVKVISPEEIKSVEKPLVLLAGVSYLKQMIEFLSGEGVLEFYEISELLKADLDDGNLSDYARGSRKLKGEYSEAISDILDNRLVIKNIDLVLTQFCNLRCRDCGSLMPYYKKPTHFDPEYVTRTFDAFLEHVDSIKELRLLGGETFLYPSLPQIVHHYTDDTRVEKIFIYTNAVMLPTKQLFHDISGRKTCVRISDYGVLSRNKEGIMDLCKRNGIPCEDMKFQQWRDMGGVNRRNYTSEQAQTVFGKCENAKCPSFCNGKLYICPRAAHMELLDIMKNGPDEFIDFSGDHNTTRNDVEDLLFNRKCFEACYYCNGNNRWENIIPAAIQAEGGVI